MRSTAVTSATFGDLAAQRFERPDGMNPDLWRDASVEGFIEGVSHMGSPDGRYGLASWWRRPDDLFKVDQLCWALRRLTIGLDWVVGEDFRPGAALEPHRGRRYREALRDDPSLTPRGTIEKLDAPLAELGTDRGDLLHAWNFAFRRCPADVFKPAPQLAAPRIGPAENSYLSLFWEALTDRDENGDLKPLDPLFAEGMEWLVATIKLPADTRRAVREMLSAERQGA